MTMEEFVKKYGTHTPSLLVGKFIREAPEFEGGEKLAVEIGEMMGNLESALQSYHKKLLLEDMNKHAPKAIAKMKEMAENNPNMDPALAEAIKKLKD